ncbi:DUF3060 domain-containing protein [Kitasatospora sp. NPDC002227]|uniref:DUF3060 domain-containing protein n=1 Tax=Kitasatospora sp. NPDC002227 TaxID=3154773 RepID=UPI0033303865
MNLRPSLVTASVAGALAFLGACSAGAAKDGQPGQDASPRVSAGTQSGRQPTLSPSSAPPNRPAGAEPLVIPGASDNRTYNCEGRPVTVTGASNTLLLSGTCPSVTVSGGSNRITVELAGKIAVTGADNQIVWKNAINGRSTVEVSGNAASVSRADGT